MAIAERMMSAKFPIINHKIYVIAGDGCLMEGINHEASSLAGHLGLSNLIVFFDDNNISIDGKISLTNSDNTIERFISYGWHVQEIDGHNYEEIFNAITRAQESKTTIHYML